MPIHNARARKRAPDPTPEPTRRGGYRAPSYPTPGAELLVCSAKGCQKLLLHPLELQARLCRFHQEEACYAALEQEGRDHLAQVAYGRG